MSEVERQLREALKRLVEMLDDATITFGDLPPERAVEAALEFDDAYVEACELLGMDLDPRPRVQARNGAGAADGQSPVSPPPSTPAPPRGPLPSAPI